ncbi:AIPR family protein [Paenibacillus sp. MER 180]|uniref:AIPR family protein n=1 Tax=Paenibacillus sp. MER 180 TaxID=2939570 RepID=UPI002042627E|nr:AIPR family protein [Paenibacillus sp. MER 180]MCM3288950.1 AIPR family protein [Paenibacillus sp. MER 180]
MSEMKKVSNPIISGYLKAFAKSNEISDNLARDEHNLFEKFTNDIILKIYGNDTNADYEDMETGTAFGIDGVAIFVNDKMVTNIDDINYACQSTKKIEVEFIFTQTKVSQKFDRQEISDFLQGVNRFFNLEACEIKELRTAWENTKFLYSMSGKFKKHPKLSLFFVTLSPEKIQNDDVHMKAEINHGIENLRNKVMFDEKNICIEFLGLREIMDLYKKNTNNLEINFNLDKQPVPYPKDPTGRITSGYFGLINLNDLLVVLSDDINGQKKLRKGIFEDNIRDYLGSSEKFEVNADMKEQITSDKAHLFGLLNNGITIIADEVSIVTTEVTLTNYQIVNGCQTSNVIYECMSEITSNSIYIPIKLIGTTDEETKNAIIKATNSQTALKPEQLIALTKEQKSLEEYYSAKRTQNRFDLYYERRTEQYRNEDIQKTKIINIPFQIKATSALFLDLPHEVSGQYGKVEQSTRGQLFQNIKFLNSYYVSGLSWYRVETFIRNNEEGKKYRRARWHLIMLLKYILNTDEKIITSIDKQSEKLSYIIEKNMIDDIKSLKTIEMALSYIKDYLVSQGIDDISEDRKIFERKETTQGLIEFVQKANLIAK